MTELIKTERLLLRPLTLADAPGLYTIKNDFDVVKMTATWPWPVTLEYVEKRLAQRAEQPTDRNAGLGIFDGERLAGSMGGHLEPHSETGEEVIWIGYMLGRDWWGRGLMTEAVEALCTYVWSQLGAYDIYGEHFLDNPASGRVMEKVGFRHVGSSPEVWCEARQQKLPGEQYRLRVEAVSS